MRVHERQVELAAGHRTAEPPQVLARAHGAFVAHQPGLRAVTAGDHSATLGIDPHEHVAIGITNGQDGPVDRRLLVARGGRCIGGRCGIAAALAGLLIDGAQHIGAVTGARTGDETSHHITGVGRGRRAKAGPQQESGHRKHGRRGSHSAHDGPCSDLPRTGATDDRSTMLLRQRIVQHGQGGDLARQLRIAGQGLAESIRPRCIERAVEHGVGEAKQLVAILAHAVPPSPAARARVSMQSRSCSRSRCSDFATVFGCRPMSSAMRAGFRSPR